MKKSFLKTLLIAPLLAGFATAVHASSTYNMYVTFYGWLDNSPPSATIAYPQIHSTAGGTGTYSNPITFACDESELAPGTIIYVAFVKKYFIMEDDCTECDSDWSNGKKRHVDLWTGGTAASGDGLLECEDALTQSSAPVIVSPSSSESVSSTPLYSNSGNKCYVDDSGETYDFTDGNQEIECVSSLKSVTVSGASTSKNAAVVQQNFTDDTNALWDISATSSGYYKIKNVHSGLYLVVQGASKSDGAKIIQYSYVGDKGNDEWKPQVNSDGSYTFINRYSGLVLDNPGSSTATGTQFDQWSSNGGSNQKFYMIGQ
jgi:Ricin-type beta-trefoil lectin domain-like